MISKMATSRFLQRDLPDSDRFKRLSRKAVDKRYQRIKPQPRLAEGKELWTHQKLCVLLGIKHGSYFDVLDMGCGKTAVALASIDHWVGRGKGPPDRALVLVPNTGNIEGWADEVREWVPHLAFRGAEGSREQREAAFEDPKAKIVCCTYKGLERMVCGLEQDSKRKKGKFVLDHQVLAELVLGRFNVVVFDESSHFKNHMSLTFRIARQIARKICHRVNLSGTPMDKNPQDLWSQFFVVDKGAALGETLGLYRSAFFYEKEGYWKNEWVLDSRMEQTLWRHARSTSISFTQDECLDLPPCVGGICSDEGFKIRKVTFPPETWEYHQRLVETLEAAQGDFKLLDSTYTRMRQLTSGYLSFKDPEGQRHEVVFKENPKLDDLVAIIREIPEDFQIIVVNHYQKTGDLIDARLTQEKISHSRLYGKTRDKGKVVRRFKQGKDRVLLSSKSGAYGHNFQCARYIIFFESPDSALIRRQMERRLRRPGMVGVSYCIDLAIRGSIDLKILRALEQGKSLYDSWMKKGKVVWKRDKQKT